ncbi:unnamed protein product [Cuscuta europaea]|uniref:Uncharacterized protein n=1 Tax=Cuscuta europaea TaxID=41803 RepID=A0A9P0VMC8_CUSEU|nr:unnamed protein product [Cuscuta europaea]
MQQLKISKTRGARLFLEGEENNEEGKDEEENNDEDEEGITIYIKSEII